MYGFETLIVTVRLSPEGGRMTTRRATNRCTRLSESIRGDGSSYDDVSGAWPTANELEPGFVSFNPPARDTERPLIDDDLFMMPSYTVSDRNDTIPSPPPDLDSAPWQDERG
jgi:hypothetical protein